MPKSSFVDFKVVKAAITMEQVLTHYGLLDRFKRNGDSLTGPCPIHKGKNPTQFRVSISKNIFNCFSECKHGGNVLDFIAKMEKISIHAAALKAMEWFELDPDAMSSDSEQENDHETEPPKTDVTPKSKPASKQAPAPESSTPNKPLQFRLDKLQRSHPYLAERGLSQETVIQFGIGFCEKGMMAGRIAIPIHNVKGEVMAYAGRCIGEQSEENPKYKLPPRFRKSLELFNIDLAMKEPKASPLIIVEGFFDCMILWQRGARRVVALMGSTMSAAQEEAIRSLTDSNSHIIVMLDEDEAGRTGRDEIAARLVRSAFVKVHQFEKEGMRPEELSEGELRLLSGSAQ
jgi:DNA primase